MTSIRTLSGFLILASLRLPASATTIEVTVDTSAVIRDDITRTTFGSGVDFPDPQFRWLMDSGPHAKGPDTATRREIAKMNLGTMRFPHGDGAQGYIWDNPQHSYPEANSKDPWASWLTQEQMLKYTSAPRFFADGLNMDRVFQVNSSSYLQYQPSWKLIYINKNFFNNQPPLIDDKALDIAAGKAAAWVEDNNKRPPQDRVDYWEVGNEDWIHWTGAQYGQIYNVFKDKMRAKRPDIKLLAQGLSKDFTTRKNGVNTMTTWIDGLRKNIADPARDVYAYSEHEYVRGGDYAEDNLETRRLKQTQDMLAQVASGKRLEDLKANLAASPLTSKWKIWMTEFNVSQNLTGKPVELQDMGHALVIADWTGRMLEQNVERLFMHSLDHHNAYALVQFVNSGGTIEHPRVTPPGYAYSIYPQEFGKTMVKSRIDHNPVIRTAAGESYPQLAAYSSIRSDAKEGDSLRVIVINRSLDQAAPLKLAAAGARKFAGSPVSLRQLKSGQISDSNRSATDFIKWSETAALPVDKTGTVETSLPPASVTLLVIPMNRS